ncbi:unnamed protein product [Schistosoma intercalatum]|nr:unnamed protein product [Schistosoma intercalatum]CAH8634759.1 unnamed protein product [Schistosoma intercalatum]
MGLLTHTSEGTGISDKGTSPNNKRFCLSNQITPDTYEIMNTKINIVGGQLKSEQSKRKDFVVYLSTDEINTCSSHLTLRHAIKYTFKVYHHKYQFFVTNS